MLEILILTLTKGRSKIEGKKHKGIFSQFNTATSFYVEGKQKAFQLISTLSESICGYPCTFVTCLDKQYLFDLFVAI